MNALRSEQLSRRLWLAMLVIVLSVALISLPLIAGSYRSYRSSAEAVLSSGKVDGYRRTPVISTATPTKLFLSEKVM